MNRLTTFIFILSFVTLSLGVFKRDIPSDASNGGDDAIGSENETKSKSETNADNIQNDVDDDTKVGVAEKEDDSKAKENVSTLPTKPGVLNDSIACKDGSNCEDGEKSFMDNISNNKDMLMRTFYVLLGVTSIVIIYFVFRAWRLRRRRNKSRKYGLITARGSDLEMAPLDQDDDDDDDMTVFEMNGKPK